ncbi:NYN domain-containing protein [Mycolicibacterium mucogenicum]|jgi:uncharacterized LabA/DUF88 family protein|uniref:NYN domain-containing protein n=1 Tax=Mycolicibacterium mucogenicum TaxID=56689 RepID=UPI0009E68E8E|nr:NYN domain-containing protein [Mycolicibacterium mucogenicum]
MNKRAAVIIDYQNVFMTAHQHFAPNGPASASMVDPGRFARRLIDVRNRNSYTRAELVDVQVFRGLPDPEHNPDGYTRNIEQKNRWERDIVVHLTHRPLQYRVVRRCFSTGGPPGPSSEIVVREKGIDVLCALATVSAAARSDIDLVVIASHDSDLDPAAAAVQQGGWAAVECFRWSGGIGPSSGRLHGTGHLKCTRLDEEDFVSCLDNEFDRTSRLAARRRAERAEAFKDLDDDKNWPQARRAWR